MIKFENICKKYSNGIVALENINLEIPKGDFLFLVGPSGAGKSTLIKLLIREEKPQEGDIFVSEENIIKLKNNKIHKLRRFISVVFQDYRLLYQKTVFENVAYALEIQGESRKNINEKVKHYLNLVGLLERASSYPNELSGGESQRVAIARAIVNEPEVLVCDEPTGNLDQNTSWEIMNILDKINKSGKTILMATHAVDIVNKMKKHVVNLEGGKIISNNFQGSYYEAN